MCICKITITSSLYKRVYSTSEGTYFQLNKRLHSTSEGTYTLISHFPTSRGDNTHSNLNNLSHNNKIIFKRQEIYLNNRCRVGAPTGAAWNIGASTVVGAWPKREHGEALYRANRRGKWERGAHEVVGCSPELTTMGGPKGTH
jgi:hypothetical protein